MRWGPRFAGPKACPELAEGNLLFHWRIEILRKSRFFAAAQNDDVAGLYTTGENALLVHDERPLFCV